MCVSRCLFVVCLAAAVLFVVWLVVRYVCVCVSAVVCLLCAEQKYCLLFVMSVCVSVVVCLLCAEQKCCLLSIMSVCVSRCLLCGLLSVMCYVFVSRFFCVCAEQKCCLSSVMSVCVSVVVCLLCA